MRSHNFKIRPIALVLACGLTVNHGAWAVGAAPQETCQGNWKGILTVVGVVGGGWLGNQVGGGNGKEIATVVGAVGGALLGNYIGGEIDRRHCELEKIAKANEIKLSAEEVELSPIKASVSSVAAEAQNSTEAVSETSGKVDVTTWHGLEHFASGSAELTPKAIKYFSDAAKQYDSKTAAEAFLASDERENAQQGKPPLNKSARDKKFSELVAAQNLRPIVLVGYTDDTGDSSTNQQLSEKRSRAVALVFEKQGIPASRLYFRGAGETEPIADNRSEAGRASNRRVEIVELESKDKLENFMALKESNLKYYRTKSAVSADHSVADAQEKDDALAPNSAATGRSSGANGKAASADQHSVVASLGEPASSPANARAISETSNTKRPLGMDAGSLIAPEKGSAGGASLSAFVAAPGSKASQRVPAQSDASALAAGVDFGGEPFNGKMDADIVNAMGKPVQPQKGFKDALSSFSNIFVKEAQAADDHVYTAPCTADSPRYGGEYLSLETGRAVKAKTSSYSPGLYQTTWGGVINGNYVGVTPIAVLRDSFQAASAPTMYVYANTENPGANAKPALKIPVAVNVYPGDKGILYRMFAKGKSGFVCSDVVLPRKAPFTALNGNVYYKRAGGVYEANYLPAMLKL